MKHIDLKINKLQLPYYQHKNLSHMQHGDTNTRTQFILLKKNQSKKSFKHDLSIH